MPRGKAYEQRYLYLTHICMCGMIYYMNINNESHQICYFRYSTLRTTIYLLHGTTVHT